MDICHRYGVARELGSNLQFFFFTEKRQGKEEGNSWEAFESKKKVYDSWVNSP